MFGRVNVNKLKEERNLAKIFALLNHRRPYIRAEALIAYFELNRDNPEELKRLKPLLNDKEPMVRTRCALLFARLGDRDVIDDLLDIISSGTVAEQIEVLRLLPHFYSKDDPKVTQILAIALKDKKQSVQGEAIKTIGEMGIETMAFYLLDFINHPNSKIRFDTVVALGRTKNPIAIDALIGSLTDSNAEVRKAAEEAIKNIGDERGLKALKDAPFMLMVKNMNESVAKRLTTVINIGKQKSECGLPLLHKACYDEYKNIRLEAIRSIATLRSDLSIPTLIELLNDKYYDVRIEAIRALSRYNSESALNAIKKAINDPNTNVRAEAKKLYSAMSLRLSSKNEIKFNI
jgi:HEAT repeat protein